MALLFGFCRYSISQIRINQNNQTIIGSAWNGWSPPAHSFVHKNMFFDCEPVNPVSGVHYSGGLFIDNYYNNVDPSCATNSNPCPTYFHDPIIRPQWGYSLWLGNATRPLLTVYSGHFFAGTNNNFSALSDARLKSNVSDMESPIAQLMRLRPVSYDMNFSEIYADINPERLANLNAKNQNSVGLIAQEVQEIFPKLVTTTDNGYMALSYTGLIPYLLKAIQEQQKEIEALKEKIQ